MCKTKRKKVLIDQKAGASLMFLYKTVPGRIMLKLITLPFFSKCAGFLMNRRFSALFINGFIKKNNIDMSDYPKKTYTSFNDFFTRSILSKKRPVSRDGLISPCDGLLTAYKINSDSRFCIKGRTYSVNELLSQDMAAREFSGGICLVLRLTVTDYHHYCYIDSGIKSENHFIQGILHTVQPIACGERDVYTENCREYTIIDTEHLGTVIQMEVGAMMVGKICNADSACSVTRGSEKGYFEFGASTIVVLLKNGAAKLDSEFWENTENGFETRVLYGEKIGTIQ